MINSKILQKHYIKMKDFFKRHNINKTDFIIIACSGWSDSMFLSAEILKIHPKDKIIIAHFNHQLRWTESYRDELFVRNYCEKNNLKFESRTANIGEISQQNKVGIEECARTERYIFLEKISDKYLAKYIFTAHHLWDSIETFMFNLIRWTRLNWLIWIDEINCKILRPLLNITKDEILKKCRENKIEFIEDSTNLDDKYLRNHIRLNIVPEFTKINPGYEKSFLWLFEYFKELKNFVEENVNSLIIESREINWYSNNFEIKSFKALNSLLQKELISKIFKITNNGTIWLSQWNINEVTKFISDKWNNTKKEIKNMKLYKRNNKIYF